MPDIIVFTAGLDAIDANLQNSRDGLDHALTAMKDGSTAGLGIPELDRACADFHQTWQHGLDQLGRCVDVVREGIRVAKAAYEQNESTISAACALPGAGAAPR